MFGGEKGGWVGGGRQRGCGHIGGCASGGGEGCVGDKGDEASAIAIAIYKP